MTGWLKVISNSAGEEYLLFMSSEDMRYLLLDRAIYLDYKSMTSLLKTRFQSREQFLNLDGQLVDISGVFSSPAQGGTGRLSINDIKSVGVYGGGYTTIKQKAESDKDKKGEKNGGAKKAASDNGAQGPKSDKEKRIGPSYVASPYEWQPFAPKD